jgi:hypothetical protein
MASSNKLLAWIEPQSDQEFTAAFVSAPHSIGSRACHP